MTELRKSLVSYLDGPNVDAYSRLRVGIPAVVHSVDFNYGLTVFQYDTIVVGGGAVAHDADRSSAVLSVTGAGDQAIHQSHGYHTYFPGKSQFVTVAGEPGAPVAGVVKRYGYNDDRNGVFFEQNGTTDIAVTRRSSYTGAPVDERIPQSGWNLDRLDGTGPSGITLVQGTPIIFICDLQLEAGRIRVGFDVGGEIFYAHEFLTANVSSELNMSSHTLPVRVEITSTGPAGSAAFSSAAVMTEGGEENFFGLPGSITTDSRAVSGGIDPILGIRPKLLMGGVTNRKRIVPSNFIAIGDGNNNIEFQIHVGEGLLSGGTWVAGPPESAVEYNITPAGFTPGFRIDSFFLSSSNQQSGTVVGGFVNRLPLSLDATGTLQREIILVATSLGGATAAFAGINWREI